MISPMKVNQLQAVCPYSHQTNRFMGGSLAKSLPIIATGMRIEPQLPAGIVLPL
jgi:hypothetical protein